MYDEYKGGVFMKSNREHLKTRILETLPTSEESAIQGKELAALLGITYRHLKSIVQELRLEYPICSKEWSGGGYWLASSDHEIKSFINMIKAHRKSYDTTIAVMENHLGGGH